MATYQGAKRSIVQNHDVFDYRPDLRSEMICDRPTQDNRSFARIQQHRLASISSACVVSQPCSRYQRCIQCGIAFPESIIMICPKCA